jgi:hypothetical protein
MEYTLDQTFDLSVLLDWYQYATACEVCQVHIPGMDHWVLTIIKSPEPRRVILHHEGHRPGALRFSELLVILQDFQYELAARALPTA